MREIKRKCDECGSEGAKSIYVFVKEGLKTLYTRWIGDLCESCLRKRFPRVGEAPQRGRNAQRAVGK